MPGRGRDPAELGDVDEAMVNAAGERERHPVGINSPHHRPDAERGSVRRDDMQPYDTPGLQLFPGHDLRPTVAEVRELARIAMRSRFDHHGPGNPGSGVLASIPRLGADHAR